MWLLTSLMAVLLAWGAAGGEERGTYGLMRDVRAAVRGARRVGDGGARRVFGGAPLGESGGAAALLDRYWAAQCSAAWLAPHWALTAAHCVTPRVAYVRYNARRVRHERGDGDAQPVLYLYRHPKFKVVQEDEGRGEDVTLLHHDIGLVRTRGAMVLRAPPTRAPLAAMRARPYNELGGCEVRVLGYGDAGEGGGGELYAARLRLVWCERAAWYHCVCAMAADADGGTAGVCAGDSGGPALDADGTQLAVTSMGPMACAAAGPVAGGAGRAVSVLTAVAPYVSLLNNTMRDVDAALQRRTHSAAPAPRTAAAGAAAAVVVLLCLR